MVVLFLVKKQLLSFHTNMNEEKYTFVTIWCSEYEA